MKINVSVVLPLLTLLFAFGCSGKTDPQTKKDPEPKERFLNPIRWHVTATSGAEVDYIEFPDGTRCVLSDGNYSGGLQCDFLPRWSICAARV